jgi:hypothetical protein
VAWFYENASGVCAAAAAATQHTHAHLHYHKGLTASVHCRYGYIDVLRVLLEGGGNPLLLDAAGHIPLEVAQLPKTPMTQHDDSAPQ